MSLFRIPLEFDNIIHTNGAAGSFTWKSYKVKIDELGLNFYIEYDLTKRQKVSLFKVLSEDINWHEEKFGSIPTPYLPHWQLIPPNLYKKIIELDKEIHEGAQQLDKILRKNKKSIRLPIYGLQKGPGNQKPNWSAIQWLYTPEEKILLKKGMDKLMPKTKAKITNSLYVPLPNAFRGRWIVFSKKDIDQFKDLSKKGGFEKEPPFSNLYGFAVKNYENRSFSSFVITLCASLETGLKWYLASKGDSIAQGLLDKVTSPPVASLLSIAISDAGLLVPEEYKSWTDKLFKTRNLIVHSPKSIKFKTIELTRWLAIGEAIILALQGIKPYKYAGFKLIVPDGHKTRLPKDTTGILLSEEKSLGDNIIHFVLDSGVSARTRDGAFTIDADQSI